MNDEIESVLALYRQWLELVLEVEQINRRASEAREAGESLVKLVEEGRRLSKEVTGALLKAQHATTAFLEKHGHLPLPPPN